MDVIISIFLIFAGIIFLGYFAELLFKKSRIPDVLFLILAGVLLSSVFGIVGPDDFGLEATIFVNFALLYLLFQGSLNLDFRTLFASLRGAGALTVISFIFTVTIVTGLAMLIFGFSFIMALLLGFMLGGTSSAVVIPLVSQLPILKKYKSVLTIESAISDVLSIVGALTVITIITTGQVSGASVVKGVVGSFSVALVLGVVAGLLWMVLLAKHRPLASAEMVTVAMLVLVYAAVESPFIGASGAIAVLAFGLVLGNSKRLLAALFPKNDKDKQDPLALRNIISSTAKNFYGEISFFVKVFFFVYLGIIMEFSQPIIFVWALVITAGIYVARPLAVRLAFLRANLDDTNRTAMEVLIPKGLAAAVLVQLAVSEGIAGADLMVTPVFGVILMSILLTGVLIFLNGQGKFRGFWQQKGKVQAPMTQTQTGGKL